MGMNIVSGCHNCKEQVMHLRSDEGLSMQRFYRDHFTCMKNDPNCVETLSDYYQDPELAFENYKDCFDFYLGEHMKEFKKVATNNHIDKRSEK
jgi:hypothetical protein